MTFPYLFLLMFEIVVLLMFGLIFVALNVAILLLIDLVNCFYYY